MPSYSGGKSKCGREIFQVLKTLNSQNLPYVEPFCGMLNVGIYNTEEWVANDLNEDLILMLYSLKHGWTPPTTPCTKAEYDALKKANYSSALRGFYLLSCAYSSIWGAGYREGRFFRQFRKTLLKMDLSKVSFTNKDYREVVSGLKGKFIYCDPPYKNNKFNNKFFSGFNHKEFWDTVRLLSKDNVVVISEYTAPPDFRVVWEKTMNTNYSGQNKLHTEKLFKILN